MRVRTTHRILIATAVLGVAYGGYSSYVATKNSPLPTYVAVDDLGAITPDSKHLAPLAWENDTNEAFHFEKEGVTTSCGCTIASWDKDFVRPGETLNILSHLTAHPTEGPMQVLVRVVGACGGRSKELRFVLKASVCDLLKFSGVDGGSIDLGSHQHADLPVTVRKYYSRGAYKLDFDSFDAIVEDPSVKVKSTPVTVAGGLADFSISNSASVGKKGSLVTFRFFKNGLHLNHDLFGQVFYEILGPIQATPSSFLIGVVQPGSKTRLKLNIALPPGGQRLSFVAIHSVGKGRVISTRSPSDDFKNWELIYTAPNESGEDSGNVFLTFLVNGANCQLCVPYVSMVGVN